MRNRSVEEVLQARGSGFKPKSPKDGWLPVSLEAKGTDGQSLALSLYLLGRKTCPQTIMAQQIGESRRLEEPRRTGGWLPGRRGSSPLRTRESGSAQIYPRDETVYKDTGLAGSLRPFKYVHCSLGVKQCAPVNSSAQHISTRSFNKHFPECGHTWRHSGDYPGPSGSRPGPRSQGAEQKEWGGGGQEGCSWQGEQPMQRRSLPRVARDSSAARDARAQRCSDGPLATPS